MGISGPVSDANSLVGGNPGDEVGSSLGLPRITPLSNGNYVVLSQQWNGNRGAATWGKGNTGVSGMVSDANSLVGSNPGDGVGGFITLLSNGNYLVDSLFWNDNRGAVTWGNANTGVTGIVSDGNSLVGSSPNDYLAHALDAPSVTPLTNGNYVVDSPAWNGVGASTWGNGSTGTSGAVSPANSLVGSNPGDGVGEYTIRLSDGNYVVASPTWNGSSGAVTWASGA
jgi:hypothetical protein